MSFSREARLTGVRGGKSEFNWQDVKDGKHGRRDDYLGACMKASVNGRRDKDRDFFWYNKTTDTLGRGMDRNPELVKAARRLEVLERRKADAAALADALGETAETRSRAAELDLEASELRSLLERGGTERDRSRHGAAPASARPARSPRTRRARVAEEQRQADGASATSSRPTRRGARAAPAASTARRTTRLPRRRTGRRRAPPRAARPRPPRPSARRRKKARKARRSGGGRRRRRRRGGRR